MEVERVGKEWNRHPHIYKFTYKVSTWIRAEHTQTGATADQKKSSSNAQRKSTAANTPIEMLACHAQLAEREKKKDREFRLTLFDFSGENVRIMGEQMTMNV